VRDRTTTTRAALATIAVCVTAAACGRGASSSPGESGGAPPPAAATTPAPQAAAVPAPAAGPAWLLVERPSGRIVDSARAEEIERPVWPGSIAKIPLLEAALERGVVDARTALVCRRDLEVDGHRLTCSHPDLGRPLTASEALAHSCNSFFVTVASRVPREALNAARAALGWPPIGPADPFVPAALGLAGPRVAPRLLADALVRAIAEPPGGLDAAGREILAEGLRGAATFGTAEALADLPGETYAKTGTAPMPGGGFLGLAVAWRPTTTYWGPRDAGLSIVVLAPGGAGRDAAFIARRTLEGVPAAGVATEADARRTVREAPDRERTLPPAGPGFIGLPATVRVGEANGRRYRTSTVSLEEYVARAVAGEAAPGTPAAALEALAITARTYAVANLGRHAGEGFDVCDLTHCQALKPATAASRAAAAATAGRILTYGGQPAHVFYSASCGGWSASPGEIWPDTSTGEYPYLVSRAEPECREGSRWTAEISARDLARALRAAGLRGSVLRDLRVSGRTGSGRAARVRVDGFEPPEITAEAFRLAVGRTLGWNLAKSHLFDVRRVSTGYRFAGFGAGHGVGLCLTGAARLGSGGRDRAAILQAYFPGAAITAPGPARRPPPEVRLDLPAAEERERGAILTLVERGLDDLQERTGAAAPSRLTIRVHPTVESFRRATGQPWWVAGATRGERIDLLPVDVLLARGILRSTLTHELVHLIIDPVVRRRPTWVREGLAVVFGGESYGGAPADAACPSDEEFERQPNETRTFDLYARAAACVRRELDAGRPWQLIGAARD